MTHLARSLRAYIRSYLLMLAQYRANMLVWTVAAILQQVVALAVWRAAANAAGGSIGGYTANEFVGYFLTSLIILELTSSAVLWDFPPQVRSGRFATTLLRPVHPLVQDVSISLGLMAYRVAVVVPVAIVLAFVFDGSARLGAGLLLLPAVVVLAYATRFIAAAMVASTAFRFVNINGIAGVYTILVAILGGQFAPLSTFPDELETAAKVLPFYWMLGFPVELAVGRAAVSEAAFGIGVLVVWAAIGYLVFQPIWRRGLRAFESVGQ